MYPEAISEDIIATTAGETPCLYVAWVVVFLNGIEIMKPEILHYQDGFGSVLKRDSTV